VLRHCVMDTADKVVFEQLKVNPAMTYSLDRLLSVLDALHSRGLLTVVLCASNVFTLPVALEVRRWAAAKGQEGGQGGIGTGTGTVSFIASEVLRAHPRSPGLLVSPSASNAGKRSSNHQ
jgi:hypothetical protein